MTQTTTRRATAGAHSRRDWLIPTSLILLSLVPVVAGAVRLTSLISGVETTPDNARFTAMPAPVIIHIVSVSCYCIVGAFQFHPGLRRRRPRWHRISGRILVPMGIAAAASGVWMTQFYALPAHDYGALPFARWVVGLGMISALVLGVRAVLRRDFTHHRAWMIRAYAIALGAGTQVFTSLIWFFIASSAAEATKSVPMIAGWVINLIVAEWIIRRTPPRRIQP